jgi:hypothetical protein
VHRSIAIAWAAVVAATAGGCRRADDLPDDELYFMVLEHVRSELRLESAIFVHPLLGLVTPGPEPGSLMMTDFNAYDATPASVVAHDTAAFRICSVTSTGACAVPDGRSWIVLSSMYDLEQNGTGVIVMVVDRSRFADVQQYYTVRLKRGLFRWGVVGFTRMPA